MIAKELGIEDVELSNIRIASKLHDIGKIGVKDEILHKEGKLTDEEFDMIKKHPVIGKSILSATNAFREILPLMYHHHERFDGTGYPDGKKGEDIPLGARIIAVADAFDAMTSNRPYRNKMCSGTAISILKEQSGTQFCRVCVEAFIKIEPHVLNEIKQCCCS
jgi:HD-GYP domain-containing protein (c-di-GMP phosphodiesterase class II)